MIILVASGKRKKVVVPLEPELPISPTVQPPIYHPRAIVLIVGLRSNSEVNFAHSMAQQFKMKEF